MVASTMLKGGFSNRTFQYADVSSMTRTCDADSVMIQSLLDHHRARRRGDFLLFIGTMRASAGSVMHNFKKRFRSSASPYPSGVSVALRTTRLI